MIEHVTIDGINYGFAKDFKHVQDIRLSFNRLTESVFGFSLENWYQEGSWGDYYIPYALLQNNRVVSNISINKIEFDIEGEKKTGIQIGTVMTDENYRNRGLNKLLMEKVLLEWKDRADFLYLFANNSVLDFYPKFNFEMVEEYQHSKTIDVQNATSPWKKLNMDDPTDVAFLVERIKESTPIAKISMRNNPSLIMFYCNSYKKDCIFYIKELDAIVVANVDGNTLYLDDVFAKRSREIDQVIRSISDQKISRVVLGFTPLDDSGFDKKVLMGPDTLFVLKDKLEFFTHRQWMFPVLSHA